MIRWKMLKSKHRWTFCSLGAIFVGLKGHHPPCQNMQETEIEERLNSHCIGQQGQRASASSKGEERDEKRRCGASVVMKSFLRHPRAFTSIFFIQAPSPSLSVFPSPSLLSL